MDTKGIEVNEIDEKRQPFLKQTPTSDLILLVEGQKLFVNKTILTFASPVFAKMLTADFKETDASEIELPDKKLEDIVAFLRCFYPDIMDEIDHENVYRVLPLAEEYQCNKLKKKCENNLVNSLSKGIAIQPAMKCLLASCIYGLQNLLEVSANVLCDRSSSTLEKNPLWNEVPVKGKFMLCMKRIKTLENCCSVIKSSLGHQIVTRPCCSQCGKSFEFKSNINYREFLEDEIRKINEDC